MAMCIPAGQAQVLALLTQPHSGVYGFAPRVHRNGAVNWSRQEQKTVQEAMRLQPSWKDLYECAATQDGLPISFDHQMAYSCHCFHPLSAGPQKLTVHGVSNKHC
ncbi:uncharacterized protein LOC144116339 [Amblyomma americanum]|uniref:Uncharacterized protein n=1 Tax=Amblyomma americanum TaxID=6943 RepID=A0AAQ4E0K5_AMBAM